MAILDGQRGEGARGIAGKAPRTKLGDVLDYGTLGEGVQAMHRLSWKERGEEAYSETG